MGTIPQDGGVVAADAEKLKSSPIRTVAIIHILILKSNHLYTREILAHITGWDDAIIASVSAHIAGGQPGTPALRGLDVYNAETVATREGLDYEHIYREYLRTRDILIDLIGSMPLEKATQSFTMLWGDQGDLKTLLTVFIEHEIEHADDVRKLISGAASA